MRDNKKMAAVVFLVLGAVNTALGAVLLIRHGLEAETSWADPAFGPALGLAAGGALALVVGLLLYGRGLSNQQDTPATFLSAADDGQVVQAIESFEKRTSGELRVHLEHQLGDGGDLMAAAKVTFDRLGLTATRERNGVLFFVAVKERKFAVLGDSGIDQKVPKGFWDNVVAAVGERFKQGKFGDGLVEGIKMAGEQLATHFPPRADDVNELPNQISRGT
ncbi:MAG TPA: TPM domain-containing protein [Myxococcales bacterium]|nr:TPM domain-containing protein [Myxococcales bacterium]